MERSRAGYKTDRATSLRMSAVRPIDTTPERLVRRVLTGLGYSYRLNRSDLPGRPDVVFASRKKVIFVHGCFWHRHRRCSRATMPARNEALWQEKFDKTVRRDQQQRRALELDGWQVLVVWECEAYSEPILITTLQQFMAEEVEPC
jgi:DNA mismatch endonuclease, patch repair protein